MKNAVFGVILLFWAANARGDFVTTTYEFIPGQSSLLRGGGIVGSIPTYYATIEGSFQLNVDFSQSTASFENINATLSRYITFKDISGFVNTNNLNIMFHLTEMESINVNENSINFIFSKNIPQFPDGDVRITLTLFDNFVRLEGGFREYYADGFIYKIDAIAYEIPEPSSFIILVLGVLILRKNNIYKKRFEKL